MVKFYKIKIKPLVGVYENISYIPDVIRLLRKFKHKLFDDYFFDESQSLEKSLIHLIARTTPCFWVITAENGDFRGFVYLDDWQGSSKRRHSATITTCIDPKYWGAFTKLAGKRFVKYAFRRYKLRKLKAEVYSDNKNAVAVLKKLGFTKECTLKSETIVAKKPVNIDVYSIIKQETPANKGWNDD